MAPKKTAAKGKSTAIVPWKEKFAQYAKETTEQVKSIGGGGIGISWGHNSVSVGGTKISGSKLDCIILGSCAHNRWFKAGYDKDNKQPPDCYAFAIVADDPSMAPHATVKEKQSVLCADCEKNVFGTAKVGKGKACANTLRLGVLLSKDVEDGATAASSEIATAGISPTNLKRYKTYVSMLEEEYGRPPWAVVTQIDSQDDEATQIRLEFKMVELIEDADILTALEKRFLKIQDVLQTPYPAPSDKKTAPKSAAGKSKKFAGVKAKK